MPITPSAVSLQGRVAVVTGGGAGIGRGIAAGLAAFGARVAIWERDEQSCASAAAEVDGLGMVTDVRDAAAVDAVVCLHATEPHSVHLSAAVRSGAQPLYALAEEAF